jgi:uncharacterized membrane protein YfcA
MLFVIEGAQHERCRRQEKTPGSLPSGRAPRTVQRTWTRIRIRFGGENFDFNPWAAAVEGFCISLVCSLLGVGGGFLVTPFLASVLLYLMYLVVGTSLIALMLPLAMSVATYLILRVHVDWALVATAIPGVLVGSFLGPGPSITTSTKKCSRHSHPRVLFATGVYYMLA